LIHFELYKSPKIPTHILVFSKKEIINYEYDFVATRLSTIAKELEKSTKCNLQLTLGKLFTTSKDLEIQITFSDHWDENCSKRA
jgi:hypothetical protein